MAFAHMASAQAYRPESFGATSHTLHLEREAGRMDAFRASRDPVRPRADDGFTLRRAQGPKIGNASIGFRRKF
ncbi:MAG: hypothetical protein ACT4P4_03605 [Betaproteobacteria bacterium]